MRKPPEGIKMPDYSGQTKTMFYVEGNTVASLVTNRAGKHVQRVMPFPKAEAALDWCRQHSTVLVYFPVRLEAN